MQLSEGFDLCQRITGNTVIFTPRSRQWAGQSIQYSALIESLHIRVSQPSLGPPGPPPEGLEDKGNLEGGEAYRSWQWAQPRRQLDIYKKGQILASVSLLNREPFYIINLMPYLSSQSTARLGFGSALEVKIADVGFGPLSSQDTLVIYGEGVQEADVEDLDPQFSSLEESLGGLIRSQVALLRSETDARLRTLETWTIAQTPKIEALRLQGDENTLALAQTSTDLRWIRQNWGSGGGGGGTGGENTTTLLTSIPGAVSEEIPGAGKFRNVPPGTYRIKISIDPGLLSRVPADDDPKTIEVVSWSEEPQGNRTGWDQYGNSRYNWNDPAIVRWIADLPRAGGEVTITSTTARRYFGLKIRNSNQSDSWNNYIPYNYYLDGVFASEQALAGYSAEWVARSF